MTEWNATKQKKMYEENTLLNRHKVAGWSNIPGHSHSIPGLWDWDNKTIAGTVCEQCRRWNINAELEKQNSALKKQLTAAVEALQRLQGWRESDYSRDNPFDFMFETALNALKQIEEMNK